MLISVGRPYILRARGIPPRANRAAALLSAYLSPYVYNYMSSARGKRVVTTDHYESSQRLARRVAGIATALRASPLVMVDPCAGHGSIYEHLPAPKRAYDLHPQFEGCVQQDFLTSKRPTEDPMMLVLNPPFSLGRQRNGVVGFLNHAAGFLRAGEVAVCVAPQSMRRWINIRHVDRRLHLVEEHVCAAPCSFRRADGRTARVRIVVQVWRLADVPRVDPEYPRAHADIRVGMALEPERPVFFVKNWGSTRRIGAVCGVEDLDASGDRCAVGTLRSTKGTAYCVYGDASARARFQELFDSGDWARYCRCTSAGIDNPNVNVREIYGVFERGVAFYAKQRWGVRVVHSS